MLLGGLWFTQTAPPEAAPGTAPFASSRVWIFSITAGLVQGEYRFRVEAARDA